MFNENVIFDTKQFDDDFYRLNALIAAAARETEGYLGEESWEDPNTGRIPKVYYRSSENGLKQLIAPPKHIVAKQRYSKWLSGYQVVISQVMRT